MGLGHHHLQRASVAELDDVQSLLLAQDTLASGIIACHLVGVIAGLRGLESRDGIVERHTDGVLDAVVEPVLRIVLVEESHEREFVLVPSLIDGDGISGREMAVLPYDRVAPGAIEVADDMHVIEVARCAILVTGGNLVLGQVERELVLCRVKTLVALTRDNHRRHGRVVVDSHLHRQLCVAEQRELVVGIALYVVVGVGEENIVHVSLCILRVEVGLAVEHQAWSIGHAVIVVEIEQRLIAGLREPVGVIGRVVADRPYAGGIGMLHVVGQESGHARAVGTLLRGKLLDDEVAWILVREDTYRALSHLRFRLVVVGCHCGLSCSGCLFGQDGGRDSLRGRLYHQHAL